MIVPGGVVCSRFQGGGATQGGTGVSGEAEGAGENHTQEPVLGLGWEEAVMQDRQACLRSSQWL